MKKDFKIQIIEDSHNNVRLVGKDFRFLIALRPKDDSLEINLWEKRFGLTDSELVTMTDKNVIDRIRLDAAIEVFTKFYQDNFIKES